MRAETDIKEENKSYKICFLGMAGSGKTSIINRIVNNSFTEFYDPTFNRNEYNYIFEPYDEKIVENSFSYGASKLGFYVDFILEDTFGINNLILQTPERNIKSNKIVELRKEMIKEFQDIILTSKISQMKKNEKKKSISEKRNFLKAKKSNEYDESIIHYNDQTYLDVEEKEEAERLAIVFVLDIFSTEKLFNETLSILDKLKKIENASSCKPVLKFLILNKCDLQTNKRGLNEIDEKEKMLKSTYDCDVYKISAKTLENFNESFSKIFNKICFTRILDRSMNTEKTLDFDELEQRGCVNFSCTRGYSCG